MAQSGKKNPLTTSCDHKKASKKNSNTTVKIQSEEDWSKNQKTISGFGSSHQQGSKTPCVGRTLLSDAFDLGVEVAVGVDVAVASMGRTLLSDVFDLGVEVAFWC